MESVTFAHKGFFWLLLLIPVMTGYYIWMLRKKQVYMVFSGLEAFSGYKKSARQRLRHLPFVLLCLSTACIVVALARPQTSSGGQNVTTEGIDMALALDISPSMLAEDLRPNRIDAAKKVAVDFIESRPNDRIGLVIFAGESFTQCPITSDHAVLKNLITAIESGMLSDGTAIGEGLATAVNRVKESKAKSKVVILLTDGVNNVGEISQQTAGDIAKAFGVRVYTIGVGTRGMAPYPFKTPFGIQYQNVPVDIDEATLKGISSGTGARYFRATRTSELKSIYAEIDQLEKTKIEVTEFHHKTEQFYPWIMAALLLLAVERFMQYVILRTLP